MKQRGFTLIELVIVVSIVGILASGAMPLARWSAKRSKEYVLQQNLRIIRNAIDQYHDAAEAGLIEVPEGTSGYPESLKVLVEGVPLLGQMPPVMPGVSDQYGATGPGLSGGLSGGSRPGVAGAAGASAVPGTSPQQGGGFIGAGGTTPERSGLSLGSGSVDGGQASSRMSGAGSRISSGLSQQQSSQQQSSLQGAQGPGSTFERFSEPGTVGQLGPQANEPLIGPDGKPVLVMFLRRLPVDPMTGTAEWGVRCYGEPPTDRLWCGRDVFDIYSKALSDAIDGTKYRDW